MRGRCRDGNRVCAGDRGGLATTRAGGETGEV